ncbi:hypothetical protein B0T10DRAFT_495008 [Thelonectria olida]|uniref:PD-(D/E)XK nuclease-like domain-containing protein n=1 Tax=Thelonectria olida TaxID=1576542 RepID=A0A9P8VXU2_9HYPO|nr:hypothetical protein B0T10DRAFT_495008 [Thelonectria olida]
MYATEADVARWLSSITDLFHHPLPPFEADGEHDRGETSEIRHCKRRKLDRHRRRRGHGRTIPSPPISEPAVNATMSSSFPRKRSRNDDDADDASSSAQSDGLNNDITPRPGRFLPDSALEWVPFSADRGPESPSRTSSASNQSASASNRSIPVSNRSSPSKQFRNAEMKETGFTVGNFRRRPHPESLKTLRIQLRDIGSGHGILPASLENELQDIESEIPPYAFDKNEATRANTEAIASNLPPLSWVQTLLDRADECHTNREAEASWNADVYAPVLEQVFRSDRFASRDLVDFRWCPSAQILPPFKPRDAPSKMVDFCVFIRPDRASTEERAINAICHTRPGHSINHTDLGNFCKHPIALSIETKRPGEQGDNATLQMGTWHSAQWRSLRYNGDPSSRSIEFLPGLIVQGHDWQFVASVLDESGKALLLRTVRLGGTDSELGVYSLIMGLQRLRRWIKEEYWPAFISDMLNQA